MKSKGNLLTVFIPNPVFQYFSIPVSLHHILLDKTDIANSKPTNQPTNPDTHKPDSIAVSAKHTQWLRSYHKAVYADVHKMIRMGLKDTIRIRPLFFSPLVVSLLCTEN